MGQYYQNIIDVATPLKDAGAISSSAAALVGGSASIIDVGAAFVRGVVLINVSAMDATTGDESYALCLQGSNSSTFASGNHPLAVLPLGGATAVNALTPTLSTIGVYYLPFGNLRAGVLYRYLRMYSVLAGTSPSIDYVANMTKDG